MFWLGERSFNKIKKAFISTSILIYSDCNKPFKLHSDASDIAIASLLGNDLGGIEKPLAYFSRKLTSLEQNYSVTEKEAITLVKSIKHSDYYLHENKFTEIVDH